MPFCLYEHWAAPFSVQEKKQRPAPLQAQARVAAGLRLSFHYPPSLHKKHTQSPSAGDKCVLILGFLAAEIFRSLYAAG